jgi:hypothetical protein
MSDPLAAEQVLPAAPTRSGTAARRLVVGLAAAAVLGAAGVAYAVASFLSGGGLQPEALMPADVVAYADLDLDPAAGQKANLLRFSSAFAGTDARFADAGGIRSALVDRLLGGATVDPDEVEAWLGDRYAVALLGGDAAQPLPGAPQLVLALQVTDEAKAEAWLTDALDGDGTVRVTQGYALVGAPGVDLDAVVAAATEASLADSEAFRTAMDPLGSGLAQVYLDVPALRDWLSGFGVGGTPAGLGTAGPLAAVLKAEPDALELVASAAVAGAGTPRQPTQLFGQLPDSTAAAFAMTGAGDALIDQWDEVLASQDLGLAPGQLRRELRQVERQTGLVLPDDLRTLLGDDLVVALDGTDLARYPELGARVVTDPDDAARVVAAIRPQLAELTGGYGIEARGTADGWVLATSAAYADQLTAGGGGLLDRPDVRATVPDIDAAVAAFYLDFAPLAELAGEGDLKEALTALSGLGMTVTVTGDQSVARLRVTVG